jgi:hypothetical protein
MTTEKSTEPTENLSESTEVRLLTALIPKPLSTEELVAALVPTSEHEIKSTLYELETNFLIVKKPVVGGGCRDCACDISYAWRLTFKGRQAIGS